MLATLSLLALQTATSTPAPPLHWPSWRGPTGDGIAPANVTPPLTWSEDENVRWKVPLPGLGCSSPIVVGDRLYLTAAVDLEAVPEDEAPGPQPGPPVADHLHRFLVLALDRRTGAEVWRSAVLEARPHEAEHETGSHASPSIATDGEHLVAFFGSRGLFVLDLEGEVRWSQQLGRMTTLVGFGEGSSPALADGTVVVQWDEEGPSFVAAFDVENGEERWRVARDTDSSWGSPSIAHVDGRGQVVLGGSDVTRGHDLATGAVVWSCGGMSKNPTTSPLVHDGIAYVMNSYRGNVTQAIRLAGAEGDVSGTEAVLWTLGRGAAYVPTPVAHEGLLYYLRDSTGVLNCVDARTGEARYTERLGAVKRIHASPIVAAGRLYVVSREAGTVVVKAGAEFELLAQNELDDVFDASPAFVGDAIYMRGRSYLYCLGEVRR